MSNPLSKIIRHWRLLILAAAFATLAVVQTQTVALGVAVLFLAFFLEIVFRSTGAES